MAMNKAHLGLGRCSIYLTVLGHTLELAILFPSLKLRVQSRLGETTALRRALYGLQFTRHSHADSILGTNGRAQ